MRRILSRIASRVITSQTVQRTARVCASSARRVQGKRPVVRYFHDLTDPYSYLALQLLAKIRPHYAVNWDILLVSPPAESAAPEREKLSAYARRDAALLAQAHGLAFPAHCAPVSPGKAAYAARRLAQIKEPAAFIETALALGEALMADQPLEEAAMDSAPYLAGDTLREQLGHYLGATFHYEGEWYWGPDRLPYLEKRLKFARIGKEALCQFRDESHGQNGPATGLHVDFFLSLRSPYSYLAAERASALARRHGAKLRLRYVLPMVMRGLPVPAAKRLYILRDTTREALRRGLPFGDICDPVGPGTERGLSLLHGAVQAGKGEAFAHSFLRGVFAEGLDAATQSGLQHIASRAGLDGADVSNALRDSAWRIEAEANREELFGLGLWGVPSFRVEGCAAHWGQDRLWAVERDLLAHAGPSRSASKPG